MKTDDKEFKEFQRRAPNKARMISVTLGLAAMVAIIFIIYGCMQGIEADYQAERAMQKERAALIAQEDALRQRDRAENAEQQLKQLREEFEKCKGR